MTYKEAADRIENHMRVHASKEPFAVYITEALDIAVNLLRQKELESHMSMCKKRCEDRCNDYCDGWSFYEDCYEPSE